MKIEEQALGRCIRKFNFVIQVIEAPRPSRQSGTGHVPADILERYPCSYTLNQLAHPYCQLIFFLNSKY